eukprot:2865055-Amphidinium_carterae.2
MESAVTQQEAADRIHGQDSRSRRFQVLLCTADCLEEKAVRGAQKERNTPKEWRQQFYAAAMYWQVDW